MYRPRVHHTYSTSRCMLYITNDTTNLFQYTYIGNRDSWTHMYILPSQKQLWYRMGNDATIA